MADGRVTANSRTPRVPRANEPQQGDGIGNLLGSGQLHPDLVVSGANPGLREGDGPPGPGRIFAGAPPWLNEVENFYTIVC